MSDKSHIWGFFILFGVFMGIVHNINENLGTIVKLMEIKFEK